MALQGTFDDFGLADIFQLIGLQKKTGVLTVQGIEKEQVVSVSFEKGMVVFADAYQRTEEERLGSILLRTRRITPATLQKVIDHQEKTAQRMGHILVRSKLITSKELSKALQMQMKETVYGLFRWKEGSYHFSPEVVTYDKDMYAPVPSEFLLMEGTRMIDEWPIIEKKIPSYQVVFEKVPGKQPAGRAEQQEDSASGGSVELDDMVSIVGVEGDLDAPAGSTPPSRTGLPPQEDLIYRHIDGRRTVQELIDISSIGEFETCKILYSFISVGYIKAVDNGESKPSFRAGKGTAAPGIIKKIGEFWIAAAVGAALFLLLLFNPWSVFSLSYEARQHRDEVGRLRDMMREERLRFALEVFYLEKQAYPADLDKLKDDKILESDEIRDSRGVPFPYQGGEGSYNLGEEGE